MGSQFRVFISQWRGIKKRGERTRGQEWQANTSLQGCRVQAVGGKKGKRKGYTRKEVQGRLGLEKERKRIKEREEKSRYAV